MGKVKSVVWDPQLFKDHYETLTQSNRILLSLENRKLEFYLTQLKLKSTDVVLDVGCGYGRFSKLIINDVKEIIGIDINPENISYAKKYVGANFDGHVADLSSGLLLFPNQSIDKVVIDNVLMFFSKSIQYKLLKEVKRVLTKEGVVVFNVENSRYFLTPFSFLFFSLYKLKAILLGKAFTKHHKYPLSFYERVLRELGFSEVNSIGDTFYRNMGLNGIQVFPKFLHSYIEKFDQSFHNTSKKKIMASFTIAASLK